MAIRTIRTMGDDVLRKKCKEVTEITKREITLINEIGRASCRERV